MFLLRVCRRHQERPSRLSSAIRSQMISGSQSSVGPAHLDPITQQSKFHQNWTESTHMPRPRVSAAMFDWHFRGMILESQSSTWILLFGASLNPSTPLRMHNKLPGKVQCEEANSTGAKGSRTRDKQRKVVAMKLGSPFEMPTSRGEQKRRHSRQTPIS